MIRKKTLQEINKDDQSAQSNISPSDNPYAADAHDKKSKNKTVLSEMNELKPGSMRLSKS
jgi:hypothetical protein